MDNERHRYYSDEVKEMKKLIKLIAMLTLVLALGASLLACTSQSSTESAGGAALAEGSEDAGAEDSSATKISEFAGLDLNGNEVTQAVFAEADITMINYWGTYCPPCIAEMPELAKLEGEYGGRLQLIGVPIDVDFTKPDSKEYKAALEILESAGATYKNVQPVGGLAEYTKHMQYVPTSIFVDPEGNIVGGPVVGGVFEEYRKNIEGYLAEHE